MEEQNIQANQNEEFDERLVELIIGLQSTAWMALGKQMNPMTGKIETNTVLAKDCIDTLLMIEKKTKGNLTETELELLKGSLQDLQLNFVDVLKEEEKKKEGKEDNMDKENKLP